MHIPVSIIIPAHNEEKVIASTLMALMPGIIDQSFEVIVVCNGCTDCTAQVIMSQFEAVICLETPVASKSYALNLGDTRATRFPRIYQDADVVLNADAVRALVTALCSGEFLAASPGMIMNCRHASWLVRSYYDIWQRLPYVREGMVGVGVYALSEQGRRRFDKFPDLIADDGYVRALFQPHERTAVPGCWSEVRSPKNLEGLIKIKTRSRKGRYQLAHAFPELMVNEPKAYAKTLLSLVGSIHLWTRLAVYLYVNLITRMLAWRKQVTIGAGDWERDETSRDSVVEETCTGEKSSSAVFAPYCHCERNKNLKSGKEL